MIDTYRAEIKRAQDIIDKLKAEIEEVLTKGVSADEIAVILSENAEVYPSGNVSNIPYLSVRIAEAIDRRIQAILGE